MMDNGYYWYSGKGGSRQIKTAPWHRYSPAKRRSLANRSFKRRYTQPRKYF